MCGNILSVVFCPVTSLVSEWGFFFGLLYPSLFVVLYIHFRCKDAKVNFCFLKSVSFRMSMYLEVSDRCCH